MKLFTISIVLLLSSANSYSQYNTKNVPQDLDKLLELIEPIEQSNRDQAYEALRALAQYSYTTDSQKEKVFEFLMMKGI